jgi:hypothetical protein
MRKDLGQILVTLQRDGWIVKKTGGGHFCMVPPDKTKPKVFCPSTPSDSARGMKNTIAQLRRAGAKI